MVSKNRTTLLTSLHQKKYRNKYGLFIAEGLKVVKEIEKSRFEAEALYTIEPGLLDSCKIPETLINETTLKKISALTTPNRVLGVFRIPEMQPIVYKGLIVALDGIRDPGNLGTIIRLCDWFGVKQLVCSHDTVDCYNPKVVQASMGSLARVNIIYESLEVLANETRLPLYAATMSGENMYTSKLPEEGILVMGNEANGISQEVLKLISTHIAIPQYGELKETESLNVATATAIILSEFKRRTIQK
ncbi:TrmH family RNA methyltransferase [Flavobacteriaceae bacterium M23B6Z8]